jgi:predicted transcriptional regulator
MTEALIAHETRKAFRQTTLEAWDEYVETGLYVTGDEIVAWLKTWGDEDEQVAPECHR